MSAVRMVAYGVLEMKHQENSVPWLNEQSPEEKKRLLTESYERDQLRKLVSDELARYGLLLQRSVVAKGVSWRTKQHEHTLYGQMQRMGFPTRPILHQGSFKECCVVAAKLLDELDAAQVPDVKGPSSEA